jgi:MOSC domain-containing protein YiiM
VQTGLDNRGGLRANVVRGGTISVGDQIAELPDGDRPLRPLRTA